MRLPPGVCCRNIARLEEVPLTLGDNQYCLACPLTLGDNQYCLACIYLNIKKYQYKCNNGNNWGLDFLRSHLKQLLVEGCTLTNRPLPGRWHGSVDPFAYSFYMSLHSTTYQEMCTLSTLCSQLILDDLHIFTYSESCERCRQYCDSCTQCVNHANISIHSLLSFFVR